jgi:hypothetical protein
MSPARLPRPIAIALVLIAAVAVAGCSAGGPGSGSSGPSSTPLASAAASGSPSASAIQSLAPFVCTPSVSVARTSDRAQITVVRVGTHAGYDRIVFEFDSGIPDAVVAGVLPPFYADPSGLEVKVLGTSFLKLTMHGASGVAPDGTVSYGGSTDFKPAFSRLAELVEGGDFEAVSTWYLGLQGGACLRVMTLADPARLVIDIQH